MLGKSENDSQIPPKNIFYKQNIYTIFMKKYKPQKIEKILNSVLAEHGYIDSYYKAEIINKWPKIVGEKISEFTKCTEFKDGILYVQVTSAPWRQEISFLKRDLIQKIKRESSIRGLKDIRFY